MIAERYGLTFDSKYLRVRNRGKVYFVDKRTFTVIETKTMSLRIKGDERVLHKIELNKKIKDEIYSVAINYIKHNPTKSLGVGLSELNLLILFGDAYLESDEDISKWFDGFVQRWKPSIEGASRDFIRNTEIEEGKWVEKK